MRFGFIYDQEGDIKSPTFGAGINFNNYGFDLSFRLVTNAMAIIT